MHSFATQLRSQQTERLCTPAGVMYLRPVPSQGEDLSLRPSSYGALSINSYEVQRGNSYLDYLPVSLIDNSQLLPRSARMSKLELGTRSRHRQSYAHPASQMSLKRDEEDDVHRSGSHVPVMPFPPAE